MRDWWHRWRVAWLLSKVITRNMKLTKIERRKPRDDRRSFLVLCDQRGRVEVRYYDAQDEYERDYDELSQDLDDNAWIAGYNKWMDTQ